jgi:uncharacterized protein YciI
VRYVVFHHPGPGWLAGVDFRQQPGVADHIAHYARLFERGGLEMGGPFLMDDAGGMMIASPGTTREQIDSYAAEDPAIRTGLLTYEVRPWYVPMDSRRAGE